VFVAGAQPMEAALPPELREAPEGAIVETCPAAAAAVGAIAERLAAQGGVALFVDYGHTGARTGSTLQAVRAHRKVDALAAPGDADLTAHVDFAALARAAQARGARWCGTVEQGVFLSALGIDARAHALAAAAPDQADAIDLARQRLVGVEAMGSLFKVMALAHREWPAPAGF
jgi:NADH dehydrogenase [ubiquinone] 1 alpha subcomplex assembly factor 7